MDPSEQKPAGARASYAQWLEQLSHARHSLRNPLGEILGFAEVLLDEAREKRLPALVPGLQTIRHAANRILADVNHALNPDARRLNPEVLSSLRQAVQSMSEHILATARTLSDRCDELELTVLSEDLLRIMGSARLLDQTAAAELAKLPGQALAAAQVGEAPPTELAEPEPRRAAGEPGSPAGGGTVLVVDDHEPNRALLARRLRNAGYRVSLAENGQQALERLATGRFDLVLLDILMPEMDGFEVLGRVKANPATQNIPVIMLSAVDDLDAVVRSIDLGAEDYLPKPFPAPILRARIEACLARKRLSDQLRKYTEWLFGKALFAQAVGTPASLVLKRQERTILFADLRGFTHWSESRPPEEVVNLLNRYFESAEQVWAGSTIIKTEYTGDEIMGVFPTVLEAVRIACALRTALGPMLVEHGLSLGAGIHVGPVVEGVMGGGQVKAYRFVGDTVNTARRICDQAENSEVLLSAAARAQLETAVEVGTPRDIHAKGKSDAVRVWPAVGIRR